MKKILGKVQSKKQLMKELAHYKLLTTNAAENINRLTAMLINEVQTTKDPALKRKLKKKYIQILEVAINPHEDDRDCIKAWFKPMKKDKTDGKTKK